MALVRPKQPFYSTAGEIEVMLDPSVILDDRSVHVKAYPDMFEPVTVTRGFEVEEATARPGEARHTRRS